jgi:hypothetical protein
MSDRTARILSAVMCTALVLTTAACSFAASTPSPSSSSTPAPQRDAPFSDEEYTTAIVDCLAAGGWEVTVDEADGGITYSGPQQDKYAAALTECSETLDSNVQQLSDLSADQWHRIYELESATADCLRTEGIDVPPIPSEQVFVERYQGADPWLSYGFVGNVSEHRWNELNSICPQPEI